jgi:hypothetical protein
VIAEYSVKVFPLFVPEESMLSKFAILFLSFESLFSFSLFLPEIIFSKRC